METSRWLDSPLRTGASRSLQSHMRRSRLPRTTTRDLVHTGGSPLSLYLADGEVVNGRAE